MNVNFDQIELILNGAAITIQCAWRSYKNKKDLSLTIRLSRLKDDFVAIDTFQSYLITKCINNNFIYDVKILINNVIFHCHSLVLWHSSLYFRNLLIKSDKNLVTYQFQVNVSTDAWEIIQKFIYGYEIWIPDNLMDELERASKELKIDSLLNELNEQAVKNFTGSLNKNHNNNSSSNPSLSLALSLNSIDDQASNFELYKPFQLISNNYKFFKCIINLYRHNKFTYSQTLHYLSTKFVDYSQMNDHQLNKCILMLKTYLKLRNSDLILKIIEIYLNKKV